MRQSGSENEPANPNERSIWQWLQNWALLVYEKFHSLDQILTPRYVVFKLIWLICLFVSMFFCVFLVIKSIGQYYKFEVTTKIRDIYHNNLTFPAITICNANPMGTPEANEVVRKYYMNNYNVNISSSKEFLDLINNKTISNENEYIFYSTFDPEFNPSLRESLSFNSVFVCLMRGVDCNISRDFKRSADPKFGSCLKFNHRFHWKVHSKDDFLLLVVFLGDRESSDNLFYSLMSGILVSIDDQHNTQLSPNWFGIRTGSIGQLTLSKTRVSQMPQPYSNCLSYKSIRTVLSIEMEKLNMTYSRSNCFVLCRQKQYIDEIGCYDLRYPRILNASPCADKFQFEKLKKFTIDTSSCFDLCPQECESTSFSVSVSYLDIPSVLSYHSIQMTNLERLTKMMKVDSTMSNRKLHESIAAIRVYFQEIKVTEMGETASISFVELVSNIGGTIGLFIQFSLMTLIDFFGMGIEILIILWKNRRSIF